MGKNSFEMDKKKNCGRRFFIAHFAKELFSSLIFRSALALIARPRYRWFPSFAILRRAANAHGSTFY